MSGPTLTRVPGPFDGPGVRPAAPATPTCCCCCCCLITTLTASTYAAVTVHREAEISGLEPNRRWLLTTAAALVVVLGWVPVVLAFGLGESLFENLPDWLLIVGWVGSVLGIWLVWLRLVLGWAGSPTFPAWWWSAKFTAVTGVAFTAEVVTLGVLIYGQLLAIPAAVLVGVSQRRRLRASGP